MHGGQFTEVKIRGATLARPHGIQNYLRNVAQEKNRRRIRTREGPKSGPKVNFER